MTKLSPITSGVCLALGAALAFGVTIPVLGWAGQGVGPYSTAALLYFGASAAATAMRLAVRESGAPLTRRSVPALLVMVISGSAVAPTLFAWGLQRTGPVAGGLLLNLEAGCTAVLARLVFHEHLGRRAGAALALLGAGGCLLAAQGQGDFGFNLLGALAVAGATVAWAIDNTASRRLAELRPLTVVAAKGALGAAITLSLALVMGDHLPQPWQVVALLSAGATGYGVSLRLYLLAQRKIGSARTASVFALAPFIGAALGLAVGSREVQWRTVVAAALFVVGVVLHLAERHSHQHHHQPIEHEHAHLHDDGHHAHAHSQPVVEEHSHRHQHGPLEHAHEHGSDVHHGHTH